MGRIVLLSDLHMGAGGPTDQFRADDALAGLLEEVAADSSVTEVVLLGDTFDLSGAYNARDADTAVPSRLRDVLSAHSDVAAGLRLLVQMGTQLHVVHGNHDIELSGLQTRAVLMRALEAPDACSIRFHAWMHHVPGVLLAEHGSQHHDINASDTVVRPDPQAGQGASEPFGAELARLRMRYRGVPLVGRAAWAAGRQAGRLSSPARRMRRASYRHDVLPRYAADVGLPPEVVLRLDRLGEHQPAAIVSRLLRQSVRRGREPGYLVGAAQAVRDVLGDAAPPFLVMGHSHAADARLLPGHRHSGHRHSASVVYLNTGTWSVRGPRPRDTSLLPVRSTWVEIDPADGPRPAQARVLHLSEDGTRTILAEAEATGRITRFARVSGSAAPAV